MARRKKIEIIEVEPTPCDLANEEIKTSGIVCHEHITPEIFQELMKYKTIPAKLDKSWIHDLNALSKLLIRRMIPTYTINKLCGTCNSAKGVIDNLRRPLLKILVICEKHAPKE